jgi:SEC-C motif
MKNENKFFELTGKRLVDPPVMEVTSPQLDYYIDTLRDAIEKRKIKYQGLLEKAVREYPRVDVLRSCQMTFYEHLQMHDHWDRATTITERDMPGYLFARFSRIRHTYLALKNYAKAKEMLGNFDFHTFFGFDDVEIREDHVRAWAGSVIEVALALDDRPAAKKAMELFVYSGQSKHLIEHMANQFVMHGFERMKRRMEKSDALPLVEHNAEPVLLPEWQGMHVQLPELRSFLFIEEPSPAQIDAVLHFAPDMFLAASIAILKEATADDQFIETPERPNDEAWPCFGHLLGLAVHYQVHMELLPYVLDFMRCDDDTLTNYFGETGSPYAWFILTCLRNEQGQKQITDYLLLPGVEGSSKVNIIETFEDIAECELSYYKPIVSSILGKVFVKALDENQPDFLDAMLLTFCTGAAMKLKIAELLPHIETLNQRNLLDEHIHGDIIEIRNSFEENIEQFHIQITDIHAFFAGPKFAVSTDLPTDEAFVKRLQPNDEIEELITIQNLKFLSQVLTRRSEPDENRHVGFTSRVRQYDEDDTFVPRPRAFLQVAQPANAPCACGSGKKYKRCCGAK